MTALLADTHALLWWLADDRRLSGVEGLMVITADSKIAEYGAAVLW